MNKTQKKEKCSEILNKYPINGVIEDIDEIRFLLSIFQMHPEWEAKEGLGIKYISIVKNQYNRCFQLNRIDNSSTDISFIHSISKPSKISEIKKACRDAIREYIVKFRDDNVIYGVSTCPISGELLTKLNTHIDHYDLTFELMFKLWITKHDVDELHSKINETKDNSVITCFTDRLIIDDFINFHNSNSKLRAVSKNSNLSILKYVDF